MSAGTLTLTNNSAAVAGSGTAFTTEVAAGDFIVVTVGGVPYTLPVKSVESGTALTLVSNYTGPTQSGAAWSAVPRVAMNMVTAALVAQSAEALRGLNYDKQNWQQVFSGTGTITVRLPDGSTFTGPAWNSFNDSLSKKLDKSKNLEDIEDAQEARANLSLKGAALLDVGTTNGTVAAGDDARLITVNGKTGGTVSGQVRVSDASRGAAYISDGTNTWEETQGVFRNIIAQGQHSDTQWGLVDYVTDNNAGKAYVRLIPFASPGAFSIFQIDHTGEATARIFSPTCDERIKYDIRRIEDPLAVMRKIKGVTFRYIDTDIFGIGFTAQDVESAFPEAVSRGGDITLKNGDVVKGVKRPDTYGVAAALHHESILQLMGILKETITTISGTTSDASAREALEVLANKIPAQMK
ncbi:MULTISPECIES: tail fiber domain-containing protein [Citrobacter]|uniref:tail fiber domain-containing protein n=1 Tax=Citrobacter TaxID=544 RepID=UPI001DB6E085|nr:MULTISPECIES: tail fiber domain-containing protein [Citrobacter]MBN4807762.1 tail fiber domain-containing protein [Citrobacter braakii]MBN4813198.1 tail fiber domain-containing protein [Citrobacter braakii]MBN4822697.1 tail fiber domain-containing protein [Citrobacter braakii]MBN4836812.1 tail fiber domain-containing protein [Citrobacter braakii]MBN4850453.1 tail fiber domain-containing protein [Citrobacter braakii]